MIGLDSIPDPPPLEIPDPPPPEIEDIINSIDENVSSNAGNILAELRFSMSWRSLSDLDIHLMLPDKSVVDYNNKRGLLDVDMNSGSGTTTEPVENIAFAKYGDVVDGYYQLGYMQYNVRERQEGQDVPIFKINRRYKINNTEFKNDFMIIQPQWENQPAGGGKILAIAKFRKNGDVFELVALGKNVKVLRTVGNKVSKASHIEVFEKFGA